MFTKDNTTGFTKDQLEQMNADTKNLLESWDVESSNPEFEYYVTRAEELILTRNKPENRSKCIKERNKSNDKYRRAKIRRC